MAGTSSDSIGLKSCPESLKVSDGTNSEAAQGESVEKEGPYFARYMTTSGTFDSSGLLTKNLSDHSFVLSSPAAGIAVNSVPSKYLNPPLFNELSLDRTSVRFAPRV